MRYYKIFSLCFQDVLTDRSRSIVWFLVSISAPLVMILFWKGAFVNLPQIDGWNFQQITSYYLLFILAASMLTAHQEDDVAKGDIQRGNLVTYLLKPISYYSFRLLMELPYRVFQGSIGIICFIILYFIFPQFIALTNSFEILFLAIIVAILGFLLSYTFKLILGILAFWTIDIHGLFNLSEFTILIFGGFIIPISLMPNYLQTISYILPLSYMTYFPVIALIGKLNAIQIVQVICVQIVWLAILIGLYSFLWKKGLQRFSAVGR